MDLDSLESKKGLLKSENLRIDWLQKTFGSFVNMDEGYSQEVVGGAAGGVAAGIKGKKKEEEGKKEEVRREKRRGKKEEEGGRVVG